MSYKIGDYNRHLFIPGNSNAGSSTFFGFKLNNNHRVYINYYSAAKVQLNSQVGQVEMSGYAAPMIQASAPQVASHKVFACVSGHTNCVCVCRMSDRARFWIPRPHRVLRSRLCRLACGCIGTDLRAWVTVLTFRTPRTVWNGIAWRCLQPRISRIPWVT